MLSASTKLRLVHAMGDQKVADEIEKRLISSTPANQAASDAILATLDQSEWMALEIERRIKAALAGDSGWGKQPGDDAAKKVLKMVDVLKANTDAVAASFSGQVTGMTTDVAISADTAGAAGNVTLEADGVKDIDTLISDWNTANPANTLTLDSGDGEQVPDADIELTGGEAAGSVTASKAAMGSETVSAEAQNAWAHALGDSAAAAEVAAAWNAMISAVQAIS
jgi:hypothetical protein